MADPAPRPLWVIRFDDGSFNTGDGFPVTLPEADRYTEAEATARLATLVGAEMVPDHSTPEGGVDWRARALALATELSEARQTLDDAAKSYVRSMQDSDARETATRGRAERLERAGQALATAVRNLIEARLYEDPDVLVCRKERDDALDAWSAAVAGAGEEKR